MLYYVLSLIPTAGSRFKVNQALPRLLLHALNLVLSYHSHPESHHLITHGLLLIRKANFLRTLRPHHFFHNIPSPRPTLPHHLSTPQARPSLPLLSLQPRSHTHKAVNTPTRHRLIRIRHVRQRRAHHPPRHLVLRLVLVLIANRAGPLRQERQLAFRFGSFFLPLTAAF